MEITKIFYIMADPGLNVNVSIYTGPVSHIINLINAFKRVDIDVIPIFAGGNKSEQRAKKKFTSLKDRLPKWVTLPLRDLYKILYNFRFHRHYELLFRQNPPDFIYERFSLFHFMTAYFAKKMKIPYFLEVNGPPVDVQWSDGSYFLPLIAFHMKKVAEKANAIVVVSRQIKDYLVNQGIKSGKIFVIPNGVDVDLFTAERCSRNIRDEYGIPMDSTVIGFVGSMRRYHGLEVFVEAAEEVVRIKRETRFLLVGPFDAEKGFLDFLNFLDSKGMRESFILTGGVPFITVPEYLAAMDICVVPGAGQYMSPIKIFEYGAMGKPIIAPRVGPVEEVIKDGEDGMLISPGNPEDLKEKILRLIDNPELRRKLGSNLKRKIRAHHTWDSNALKVIEIFKEVKKKQPLGNARFYH